MASRIRMSEVDNLTNNIRKFGVDLNASYENGRMLVRTVKQRYPDGGIAVYYSTIFSGTIRECWTFLNGFYQGLMAGRRI